MAHTNCQLLNQCNLIGDTPEPLKYNVKRKRHLSYKLQPDKEPVGKYLRCKAQLSDHPSTIRVESAIWTMIKASAQHYASLTGTPLLSTDENSVEQEPCTISSTSQHSLEYYGFYKQPRNT